MWHQEYLVKNAAFQVGMNKDAAGIFDFIGKGVKGLGQIATGIGGMAGEAGGAVKSLGSELGSAVKGALPAAKPPAALTGLDKLKADQAARLAAKMKGIPPKPPLQ